jgi:type II secretory pathway pseudopilin PulG
MIEIVVSLVLLSIFSLASLTVIASSQRHGVHNRARVAAANLAQRELEFAEEQITASPSGARDLLAEVAAAGGTLDNPHPLEPAAAPGHGYVVDGVAYSISVDAALHTVGNASLCDQGPAGGDAADKQFFATLVTVTVTWEDMGSATPETVAQVFAPHQRVVLGELDTDESIIAVAVTGSPLAGAAAREGILVSLEDSAGLLIGQALTQPTGCATFTVTAPAGSERTYRVWLEGSGTTAETFVSADRHTRPSRDITVSGPRRLERVRFENYDKAATLAVRVVGHSALLHAVDVAPLGGMGEPFQVSIIGGLAQVSGLYPGAYTVSVSSGESLTVTVAEGTSTEVTLTLTATDIPTTHTPDTPATEHPDVTDDCGRHEGSDYAEGSPITPRDPCDEPASPSPPPPLDEGADGE